MRIRKTVTKLLGSAIVYPSLVNTDTWVPPHCSDHGCVDSASGEICQLNQSPWDASPNLDLFASTCQDLESSTNSKVESNEKEKIKEESSKGNIAEKDEGILVNSTLKEENKTKPIRICKRKTKKPEKVKNDGVGLISCKKNDGRKWFCSRPAQLPNSFCEYHVVQSRSYYTGVPPKPKKQKVDEKKDSDRYKDSSSSFFYYYEGFGPWRGKRRGERNAELDNTKEEVSIDGRESPVAGRDEEEEEVDEVVSSSKGTGEKKVAKKRGRKPIKCRSLKSLL